MIRDDGEYTWRMTPSKNEYTIEHNKLGSVIRFYNCKQSTIASLTAGFFVS